MAILDEFEVRIKVNGQFAPEFDNNEEIDEYRPNTISKYVEVVSGAYFSILASVTGFDSGAGNLVRCRRYLDGKWAGSNHFATPQYEPHQLITHGSEFTGFRDGTTSNNRYHTYAFANLETSAKRSRAS